MSSTSQDTRRLVCMLITTCAVVVATPAASRAQEASPNRAPRAATDDPGDASGVLVTAAALDVAQQYRFRGVRQNSTGLVVWPTAGATLRLVSGTGAVRRLAVNFNSWNSLNTGDTGSGGPPGRSWYESRLSGGVAVGFARGVSIGVNYTAYVSPNDMFTGVKEVGVTLAAEQARLAGIGALAPYALLAFELDTSMGRGQLDGGTTAGKYLELGAAPGYAGRRWRLAFPVKVGLSLGDYYELAGKDHAFGFVSVGASGLVPIGARTQLGQWDVHGGLEFQSLGETPRAFNGGDRSAVVVSFGVGLRR